MSDCLTDEQLEMLAAQASSEAETIVLHEHLQHCVACRELLAECRENMTFVGVAKKAMNAVTADGKSVIDEYLDDPKTTCLSTHLAGTVPGYQLLHEIHRGTQGVVYEASQDATGRQVAIKFLREGAHASRATRKRFEREIELAASLRHPNIIRILESGVSSTGHHYYVMDYVHGMALNRYVWRQELSIEKALALFSTVCGAINFAHQHGVIHRDLKPSNVLVDEAGVPHVLDFGLAKPLLRSEDDWASMTGEVVGTLPFMSPEQARGGHAEIDIRSDVYSLGVILYQMLTGEYPYVSTGAIADVLNHIAHTEPIAPRRRWSPKEGGIRTSERMSKRPNVCPIDEEVETIVLRALAKDPARRYPNVESLNQDIDRYLQGQPIEAKRDAGLHKLRRSLIRYRATTVVASLAVVLTSVFTGILYFMYLTQDGLIRQLDAQRTYNTVTQQRFASKLLEVGDRELERGNFTEARTQYLVALDLNQRMARGSQDNVPSRCRLVENYLRLADVSECRGRYKSANDYYGQASNLMEGLLATSPNNPVFQDFLASSEEGQANTFVRLGQPETAQQHASKALELRRELVEKIPIDSTSANHSYWLAYARLLLTCEVESIRDPQQALIAASTAMRCEGGDRDPAVLGTLALAYWRTGETATAQELRDQALTLVSADQVRARRYLERLFEPRRSAQGVAEDADVIVEPTSESVVEQGYSSVEREQTSTEPSE